MSAWTLKSSWRLSDLLDLRLLPPLPALRTAAASLSALGAVPRPPPRLPVPVAFLRFVIDVFISCEPDLRFPDGIS